MAEVKGGTFEGGHVDVDGNLYRDCTFEKCEIRYNGGPAPGFVGCSFNSCTLGLGGAASNTVAYLQAIYRGFGSWGAGSVEKLFEVIRGGNAEESPDQEDENDRSN